MSDALRRRREALAAQLEHRLTAAAVPWSELKELQDHLQLLDSAIARQRAAAERRPARVIGPMALVAAVLTLAATVRVPAVPVSIELQAGSATLDLAEGSTFGPLALHGSSHLEGVALLESPDAGLMRQFAAAHAGAFALDADEATLRGLQVPAGAQLTLQALPAGVQLRVELPASISALADSSAHVDLELNGRSVLGWDDGARAEARDFGGGEWLRASSAAASADRAPAPLELTLGLQGSPPARFSGLQPKALRFNERRDSGQAVAKVASSLEGGTLTLPATGETITIAAGDGLEIDGFVAERCEVVLASPLKWRLNGSAGGLKLRVGAFERSLKPSWLEYAARHHLAKLLWGSAAVVWGALSWIQGRFAGLL